MARDFTDFSLVEVRIRREHWNALSSGDQRELKFRQHDIRFAKDTDGHEMLVFRDIPAYLLDTLRAMENAK